MSHGIMAQFNVDPIDGNFKRVASNIGEIIEAKDDALCTHVVRCRCELPLCSAVGAGR